jgi:hypothetical protein
MLDEGLVHNFKKRKYNRRKNLGKLQQSKKVQLGYIQNFTNSANNMYNHPMGISPSLTTNQSPQFYPFYPATSSVPMTFNGGYQPMNSAIMRGGIKMRQTPMYNVPQQQPSNLQSMFVQETPKQSFQQNMQDYARRQQQMQQQQFLQNERKLSHFHLLIISCGHRSSSFKPNINQ